MVIQDMTLEECRRALAQVRLARLACEMDDQPYVVPLYLAYDGTKLFGFATMGYKIDCMRANPLVCVEVDEITSPSEWMSVLVFGTYEELPNTPDYQAARSHAYKLLEQRAMWWEPASIGVEHREYPESSSPIFYCIHIDRMSGRRASPDLGAAPRKPSSWLSRLLARLKLQ